MSSKYVQLTKTIYNFYLQIFTKSEKKLYSRTLKTENFKCLTGAAAKNKLLKHCVSGKNVNKYFKTKRFMT